MALAFRPLVVGGSQRPGCFQGRLPGEARLFSDGRAGEGKSLAPLVFTAGLLVERTWSDFLCQVVRDAHLEDGAWRMEPHPARLDLEAIASSLTAVELHWPVINDELERRGIGRKDTFDAALKMRMVSAFGYLDELLSQQIPPFSLASIEPMLLLNERVHYGTDRQLLAEYARAREATVEKFYRNIGPIQQWYEKHSARGQHPLRLAAKIYVSVLGYPQLYIEGNHRTGSLIADWISVYYGFPPFVLSAENALAYFAPSIEIKHFADKSTWRGQARLPKYCKSFLHFWEHHIDQRYLLAATGDGEHADFMT